MTDDPDNKKPETRRPGGKTKRGPEKGYKAKKGAGK
jgi:hypothetical protein